MSAGGKTDDQVELPAGGSAKAARTRLDNAPPFSNLPDATPERVGIVVAADLAPDARLRAFGHLAFGWYRLLGTPGLRFAKVLGSGRNGGFRPSPSLTHQGLFLAFDGERQADAFLDSRSGLLQSIRGQAREFLTVKLRCYAVRGRWSGKVPQPATVERPARDEGPIASLTRASIRPAMAAAFWRHAPPSEVSLDAAPGCLVAVGLGEMPLLRQATFTVWENEAAMEHYSRQGAHLDAIRAAMAGGYFSESMFARYRVAGLRGTWRGRTFG